MDRFTQATVFLSLLTVAIGVSTVSGRELDEVGVSSYWAAVLLYVAKALESVDD